MSPRLYRGPFYHFTAERYVDSIKANGINKGDVPYAPSVGENAPSLTEDSTWQHQDWSLFSPAKSEVRLTVSIPEYDPNLEWWPDYAIRKNMSTAWLNGLNKAGYYGGEEWWLYWGTIPFDWVTAVEPRPPYIRPKEKQPILMTPRQQRSYVAGIKSLENLGIISRQ